MEQEFFDLVKEMREAQKVYFKSKMSFDLIKSKQIEKRVDDMIKKKEQAQEKNLFNQ